MKSSVALKYDGFVPSLEYFGKQVFSKDTVSYRLVRRGQYAYATIHLDEGSIDCLDIREKGIISPMYTVFDVDPTRVERKFFLELLRTPMMLSRYTAIGQGSINRRKSISFETLAMETVSLPPLPEQKKIAAILSSVDEVIRATQAVIEQTRRVKEGLLQDLLTKGIGHTRFKQTEIGEIPEGWEATTLGKVAEARSGIAKNTNRVLVDPCEVAYLRVANVQNGYLDLTEIKTIRIERTKVPRYALRAGDVLMTEGGDIDKLGRGDVWAGQIDPCVHQNHVFSVRCGPRLRPRYLSYVAESSHGKAYFLAKGKQTTNLASINKTQLRAFPLPLPSLHEQDGIMERLYSVRAVEEKGREEVGRLGALKAGLLQDLLTGKVRVAAWPGS